MNINMSGNRTVINGKEYKGNNVSISGDNVIIDGVTQDGSLSGPVNVVVHGDVNTIENQAGSVTAHNVHQISTGSGDVKCNNVAGSVRTGSGDVECGIISGNVRTGSGDVVHR